MAVTLDAPGHQRATPEARWSVLSRDRTQDRVRGLQMFVRKMDDSGAGRRRRASGRASPRSDSPLSRPCRYRTGNVNRLCSSKRRDVRVEAGPVGHRCGAREVNHLRHRLDAERAEEVVDVIEHVDGHVGQAERACVQGIHPVPAGRPGQRDSGRPERVFEAELARADTARSRGSRSRKLPPRAELLLDRPERVVGERQEMPDPAHEIGAEHVRRVSFMTRSDLRKDDPADASCSASSFRPRRAPPC